MRFTLVDRRLFIRKTAIATAAAYLLLPLTAFRTDVPAAICLGALVVLHIFVLGIYLYRVRVSELDPDLRSLVARVAALVVVVYLLYAVSGLGAGASTSTMFLQATAASVLHAVVLGLLMTRMDYTPPQRSVPSRSTEAVSVAEAVVTAEGN
jgi:hypothetical protein